MHAITHTRMQACTHIHAHARTHARTHAHTHTHSHTQAPVKLLKVENCEAACLYKSMQAVYNQ
jgi:hypothetical protein